jgi:hypothetical protein
MDIPDKENGTIVLGSCEEVCCSCESSSSESGSDNNHMFMF